MEEKPRKDAMLSYAPVRSDRQRLVFRGLIWFSFLCVVAFSAVEIAPVGWRRARLVYYQRRVLNAAPQADPPYVAEPGGAMQDADGNPLNPSRKLTCFSSEEWYQFLQASQANPVRARSTIYVHGINDRHGNQLIIAVEILPGYESETPSLNVQLITLGGLLNNPSIAPVIVRPFALDFDLKSMPLGKLTFFSGQPDPSDASHFTINYELNSQRHTLDGYIDDQDVLTIQQRKELPSTRDDKR